MTECQNQGMSVLDVKEREMTGPSQNQGMTVHSM